MLPTNTHRSSLLLLCLCSAPAIAQQGADTPMLHELAIGLFTHDWGPFADDHEHGIDPNLELQFNAPEWEGWRRIGSPYPTLGITPNLAGDTSALYGGVTYEFSLANRYTDPLTRNLFVSAGLGVALHDGPLHKDSYGCDHGSDCGFGYRVLPHFKFEIGGFFSGNHGLSLSYDHMSHYFILPGENEGIDHFGIRYHYRFGGPAS